MTFRRRIVLLAAAAVATAVALAAVVTYLVVRHDLRDGIDEQLHALTPKVVLVTRRQTEDGGMTTSLQQFDAKGNQVYGARLPQTALGGSPGLVQTVLPNGDVVPPADGPQLPLTGDERDVANGSRAAFLRDTTVSGVHVRLFTARGPGGTALQIATSLTEVDDTLHRLRWILLAVTLGGVGLASGFGVGVSRLAAAPLGRLTTATERVTATGELDHRLEPGGDDEPGRLAASFNAMLAALEASRDAQRQLVADASHELRTPLTAIRANVELLERADRMPPQERAEVLTSVRGQLEDLTILVGDLVDLARPGERAHEPPEDLRLDEVVADAVARARRHAPGARFELTAEPCLIHGSRARVARAVGNLLDNAVKWSPSGAPIEVAVREGEVVVRDHGPGIAEEDLPHVFDRFYRAPAARGLPGSGLGLAIVKHVADGHGGRVEAERADGGGTRLRLTLPLSPTS